MEGQELLRYAYPNEQVLWSWMIVIYPYISGLAAGTLLVSSLYYLFGRRELRPVARLSLLTAFSFLVFAPVPLLNHLGHPERAFNIMITPNPRSAMAGFGLIYPCCLIFVALQIWFVFRPDLVRRGQTRGGLAGALCRLASLGVDDLSAEALALDRKLVKALAAVGVPVACLLSGYVGFLFGAVKANPWWSTPLMPVVFLLSAAVSGFAVLVIIHLIESRLRHAPADETCLRTLLSWLWGLFVVDVSVELLDLLHRACEARADWPLLQTLLGTRLAWSFVGVQLIAGSLLPILILGWALLARRRGRSLAFAGCLSAVLILLQVLALRWNVVIGGQLFSKSLRGFVDLDLRLFDREGPLSALAIFAGPFALLAVLARVLPLHEPSDDHRA